MQKIDYLENKIKDLNYELSFLKNEYTKIHSAFKNLDTNNYLLNPDFNINTQQRSFYNNVEANKNLESVDKWFINNPGLYFPTQNLMFENKSEFCQVIEPDMLKYVLGQDVTLSFNFYEIDKTGNVDICARVWSDANNYQLYSKEVISTGITSLSFNVPSSTVKLECLIKNNSGVQLTIWPIWAKLEKGTEFTNYTAPILSLESVKCNKDKSRYVETIYDRDSDDPKINCGYTSGINTNAEITTFDFSKYKQLIFYTANPSDNHMFFVDLSRLTTASTYFGAYTTVLYGGSTGYFYTSRCSINSSKKSFTITFTQNSSKRANNASYYCYRIEGVL